MTATMVVEEGFAQARIRAEMGQLVVVRTDGQQIILPAPSKDSASPGMIARIEQVVPSATKRRIAVIAETGWASAPSPPLQQASVAIPFFGHAHGTRLHRTRGVGFQWNKQFAQLPDVAQRIL